MEGGKKKKGRKIKKKGNLKKKLENELSRMKERKAWRERGWTVR